MNEDEELRIEAKKRVEEKIGFYWNIGMYVGVNILLFFIWFFTGQGFPWFLFPLIFWGIAVFAHYLTVIRTKGSFTERMVEDEYRKLKKEKRKA